MTKPSKLYAGLLANPAQPHGKDARPYQVRKFLDMMRRHGLDVEE